MAKYQQYAEYKDSGVEWLGETPSHWVVQPLKHQLIFMKNGSTSTQIDEAKETAPISRIETISSGEIDMSRVGFIDIKTIPKTFELDKGDILFSHINSLSMIGNLAIKRNNDKLFHGMNLLRLKLDSSKCVVDYMFWLLKSKNLRQVIEANAKPAINQASISTQSLKNIYLNIPTEKEQAQIANFLDYETAQIDTLIEKQQTLIQLLKEKCQAMISHAVTKGLNPDAPMKDSGVEWLGGVPEHWIVRRLKHTSKLQSGIPKGNDLTGKLSISVPMLRVANVQDGFLDLEDVHMINIEPQQLQRYMLQKEDVLMNEGGDSDKLGRGAVWQGEIEPCIHQNHVFAIRPYSIEPEWLDLLTRSSYAKFYFYRVAKQSTNLASISSTNIKETPLTIPPVEERKEILSYVQGKLKVFEQIEIKCVAQIKLLQERRSALISAAVTGKIDVRGWVAPE